MTRTILLLILSCPILLWGQVTIVDLSANKENEIEHYDSSYFVPTYNFSDKKVMRGLVGNHIIFLEMPSTELKLFKNGSELKYYEVRENYRYKSCKIEGVEAEGYNKYFNLSCCNGDSLVYEPSSANTVIIEEGFERLKEKLIGKTFYSLDAMTFNSTDGQQIQVVQSAKLMLKNVEIGKLSTYEFGLLFEFEHLDKKFKMALALNDYYISNGGDPKGKLVFNLDYINFLHLADSILYSKILKSPFKTTILKGEITVGMSDNEIRMSWGMPTRDSKSAGYDYVMVYEQGSSTYYFYMKGKKCVKISTI